ncbi:MAG: sulfurtransferase TusA family protein [Promethearchaeota archaeon]|nr:MAG: sulfurtransferase TusA family protein [Candidatus Lokiarchaeota archaeon]
MEVFELDETENRELKIEEELDTRGLYCPEPLFEVRNLSETLSVGQCFKVLADDPAAEEDLKRWAKRTDTKVVEFSKDGDDLIFIFKKMK